MDLQQSIRTLVLATASASLLVTAGCSASPNATPGETKAADSSKTCGTLTHSWAQAVQLGMQYPYAREPASYLFVAGASYPYRSLQRGLTDAAVIQVAPGVEQPAKQALTSLNQAAAITAE